MRCVMNVGSQHSTFLWGCVDALCSSSTTRWWPFILAKKSAVIPSWWKIKLPDIRAVTRTVLSMTDRYHTASHSWNVRNCTCIWCLTNVVLSNIWNGIFCDKSFAACAIKEMPLLYCWWRKHRRDSGVPSPSLLNCGVHLLAMGSYTCTWSDGTRSSISATKDVLSFRSATHIEKKVQILIVDCIRLYQGGACINCIAGMGGRAGGGGGRGGMHGVSLQRARKYWISCWTNNGCNEN